MGAGNVPLFNIVQMNDHVKIRMQTSKNVQMRDILCNFCSYIFIDKINIDCMWVSLAAFITDWRTIQNGLITSSLWAMWKLIKIVYKDLSLILPKEHFWQSLKWRIVNPKS
jgi:hypothetical protein